MRIVILTILLEKLLKLLEVLFLICARGTHRKCFDYPHLLDTVSLHPIDSCSRSAFDCF